MHRIVKFTLPCKGASCLSSTLSRNIRLKISTPIFNKPTFINPTFIKPTFIKSTFIKANFIKAKFTTIKNVNEFIKFNNNIKFNYFNILEYYALNNDIDKISSMINKARL